MLLPDRDPATRTTLSSFPRQIVSAQHEAREPVPVPGFRSRGPRAPRSRTAHANSTVLLYVHPDSS